MNQSLHRLVDLARQQASKSTMRFRHGAVLFSDKKTVMTMGFNDIDTKVFGYDVPSCHAEASCLAKAQKCFLFEKQQNNEGT